MKIVLDKPVKGVETEPRTIEVDVPEDYAGMCHVYGEEAVATNGTSGMKALITRYARALMETGTPESDIPEIVKQWRPRGRPNPINRFFDRKDVLRLREHPGESRREIVNRFAKIMGVKIRIHDIEE